MSGAILSESVPATTPGSLRRRAIAGGGYTALNQACQVLVTTAGMVIVARLLTPADFGLVAKVTILTGVIGLVGDLGLSLPTVQSATLSQVQLSSLYWVSVLVSATIATLIALSAPLIAWFYHDPDVIPIALFVAAATFLAGLSVQHRALLRRNLRFGSLTAVNTLARVGGLAACIVLASRIGHFALVVQTLVVAGSTMVLAMASTRWMPSPVLSVGEIRPMLKMGGNLTAWNVLNYGVRNSDNLLIGRFLGEASLAHYTKAYALLLLPLSQVGTPLSQVAVPALSRLVDDPTRYRQFFLTGSALALLIQIPFSFFAAVTADDLVLTLLGDQWSQSVPIFLALSPAMLATATSPATLWVYQSRGETDRMMRALVVTAPVYVIGFVIGLAWGPIGVACAFSAVSLIVRIPNIAYCLRPTPIRPRDFSSQLVLPCLAGSLAAVATLAMRTWVGDVAMTARLALSTLVFAAVYLTIVWSVPSGRNRLRNLMNRRIA